jgi:hypothetical protein
MLIRLLSWAISLKDKQNGVECGSSAAAFKSASKLVHSNPPEADINKSFHST